MADGIHTAKPLRTKHGIEVISVGAHLLDYVGVAFGTAYISLELFNSTGRVTLQLSPDEMDELADKLREKADIAREGLASFGPLPHGEAR